MMFLSPMRNVHLYLSSLCFSSWMDNSDVVAKATSSSELSPCSTIPAGRQLPSIPARQDLMLSGLGGVICPSLPQSLNKGWGILWIFLVKS
jgi:hypothetical protein